MDKELALIYEYKTAPEALKKAADDHRKNSTKHKKLTDQGASIRLEIDFASREYEETAKAFRLALKAWEPKGTV